MKKRSTFSERNGFIAKPQQLKSGEVSDRFRVDLWNYVYADIIQHTESRPSRRNASLREKALSRTWIKLLENWHMEFLHRPFDEFQDRYDLMCNLVKETILKSDFNHVFDFVEMLTDTVGWHTLDIGDLAEIFEDNYLAYRLIENQVHLISSQAHADAIESALEISAENNADGPRLHLVNAMNEIRAAKWPEGIRESIHSVESAARLIEPTAQSLGAALNIIENKHGMHPALKGAFSKLYGWTSDEDGIRHAVIDEPVGPIDEALALFMHGACASFVTYLLTVYSGLTD